MWIKVSWAAGDLVDAFKACNLAFKHDVQTARFLLPYIVQNAVSCGSDAALENVKAEMELVLQRGPATREGELCVQEVGREPFSRRLPLKSYFGRLTARFLKHQRACRNPSRTQTLVDEYWAAYAGLLFAGCAERLGL